MSTAVLKSSPEPEITGPFAALYKSYRLLPTPKTEMVVEAIPAPETTTLANALERERAEVPSFFTGPAWRWRYAIVQSLIFQV